MHKNYVEPLVKIVYAKARDVITTSDPDGANDGYADDFID